MAADQTQAKLVAMTPQEAIDTVSSIVGRAIQDNGPAKALGEMSEGEHLHLLAALAVVHSILHMVDDDVKESLGQRFGVGSIKLAGAFNERGDSIVEGQDGTLTDALAARMLGGNGGSKLPPA